MNPEELRTGIINIRSAVEDCRPITGVTHTFYRYPARFPPAFAAAAIRSFSKPGDIVLDPYMGGGTTIVEALVNGRRAIGCDVNSLAIFVTRVKTTQLKDFEYQAVRQWASETIPSLSYHGSVATLDYNACPKRTRNLTIPKARPIKKLLAIALLSINDLPTLNSQMFARCALLNVSQWALDGRKQHTPLSQFRTKLTSTVTQMLQGLREFQERISTYRPSQDTHWLVKASASEIESVEPFTTVRQKPTLVLTSPPYPGIHVLYHRWQVDGRRETPAPYWIAGCNDGYGSIHYTFGDRRERHNRHYFEESLKTLLAIRKVVPIGALMVQMLAFSEPKRQIRQYLDNMKAAGFEEIRLDLELGMRKHKRIWRSVPNRRWHANFQGRTHSSREVVLIHRAV